MEQLVVSESENLLEESLVRLDTIESCIHNHKCSLHKLTVTRHLTKQNLVPSDPNPTPLQLTLWLGARRPRTDGPDPCPPPPDSGRASPGSTGS